jgi:hypothetical protein
MSQDDFRKYTIDEMLDRIVILENKVEQVRTANERNRISLLSLFDRVSTISFFTVFAFVMMIAFVVILQVLRGCGG